VFSNKNWEKYKLKPFSPIGKIISVGQNFHMGKISQVPCACLWSRLYARQYIIKVLSNFVSPLMFWFCVFILEPDLHPLYTQRFSLFWCCSVVKTPCWGCDVTTDRSMLVRLGDAGSGKQTLDRAGPALKMHKCWCQK